MNYMRKYAGHFFDELEVFEDTARGHCHKSFLRHSVLDFLDNETKETAFAIYRTFFDSYRIALAGSTNPFVDLLDSPYLVPYRKLPEEIKQIDRNPVEMIPGLLSCIGMAVYKKEIRP